MTENRYFYTDPLAAAWMVQHFGMRFDCKEAETPWDICASTMCQTLTDDDEPFYIHPESLPLLAPRAGDLILHKNKAQIVTEGDLGAARYCVDALGAFIIQRDGKPYFWPECNE